MLLCVCLSRRKGSINVRIDSLRWRSERHFSGGSGGGRKLGIASKTGGGGGGDSIFGLTRIAR